VTAPAGALRGAGSRRPVRAVASSLLAVTKPRIIELLLVTTVPPMFLAEHGLPPLRILCVTLIGGTLAAASANTINCYLDRDIDAVMHRTARRPLASPATAIITPREAIAYGIVLGAAATILLGTAVNWLAAGLADAAILFYVFVYTIGLKRRTASNIVIGGAAGCFPVLVGWVAVTGSVAVPAIIMFAIIFFWTPPHFWALAMRFRDDYAAAGVPMLPAVAPARAVTRKIVFYSWEQPLAGTLHRVDLRSGRGGPRRLVPPRGEPASCCGGGRAAARADAAISLVHRIPHDAVRRHRHHRAAAMGQVVATGDSWSRPALRGSERRRAASTRVTCGRIASITVDVLSGRGRAAGRDGRVR